ncbi:hypothetical protein [Halobaculum sp. EA56]|uniref:hypothetical protein n=1 Tax=Halobaculum sp. EA56 TaxID=3421648 RepID=UPI003EBDD1D0
MRGLRYVSCDRCGLVHSDVDVPARCARCAGGDFTALVADRGADARAADAAYFADTMLDGT